MAKEYIIDGVSVLVRGGKIPQDVRRTSRFCGRPTKKQEMKKKGQLGRMRKTELMLLTEKQRNALNAYVEMGCDPSKMKQAAVAGGYSEKGGTQCLSNTLAKPFVQRAIVKALEEKGVTLDKIAEKVAEGLEAKHPFKPQQKDFHAIHKFVVEAGKMHDVYPATKVRREIDKREVRIHLTTDDAAAFEKFKRMRGGKLVNAKKEPEVEGASWTIHKTRSPALKRPWRTWNAIICSFIRPGPCAGTGLTKISRLR